MKTPLDCSAEQSNNRGSNPNNSDGKEGTMIMSNTLQMMNPTAMFTVKKAVSYIRVSTRRQAERGGDENEGFSIPAQREANKSKAASMGAMITKEFVDRGETAKFIDRPQLQAMLEYVSENNIDYVIVHKVDRLARNRDDDSDITRELRKHGAQLISTSEAIDDTPAGMLLHGIMSSIAEFYSRNLANEVMKGLNQKVKNGGTPCRAPLGYLNVQTKDKQGRELRTVIIDEERAPLIKRAFELYATGDWYLEALGEHLALRGLTTLATPSLPSQPMTGKKLNNILTNPYYKGLVKFNGAYHPGKHPTIIDEDTWQQVQDVLRLHLNGERTRTHHHYLKSTVYCGTCGSRLLIHMAKSKSGAIYPYFICTGRQENRTKCNQKAILIDVVEEQIEQLYDCISLTQKFRQELEAWLLERIQQSSEEFAKEQARLNREKDKLERKRAKLLQAHYADAIPLDMLKQEQDVIAKDMIGIDRAIAAHSAEYQAIEANLKLVLDLVEDCGATYKKAPDLIRRAFNQALFEKIFVSSSGDVTPEYKMPYKQLLNPLTKVAMTGENNNPADEATTTAPFQGLRNILRETKNTAQIFFEQCFSTDTMVDPKRIELSTSALRTRRSPS